MKDKAIILTNGLLNSFEAKTAHGLIRGTERYDIAGVVDPPTAGRDAGEVLDGKCRNIPVFSSVGEAAGRISGLKYAIVGVATVGGVLPPEILTSIQEAIRYKVSIVNGLHEFLNEKPEIVQLANQYGVELVDVRRPKARKDLHFWTGGIYDVTAPVIAVMGTDCALGKRTTCRMMRQACLQSEIKAEMIYTGQTGWLQGGKHGFVMDSTLNDFVSGELEHAIVTCWKETQADVLLIEGQSALRNPSGPCGLEFLISGAARNVVLVHSIKRKYYDHDARWGAIPSAASEIEIVEKFNSKVISLALNTEGCTMEEALRYRDDYEKTLNIPVLLPVIDGVDRIIPVVQKIITERRLSLPSN